MNSDGLIVFSVSDFVAATNQTLEFAYPSVGITGELANFKVSKGKWVYFDLKDEFASVRFFGTVYNLRGPLEEGMMLTVRGTPRLHPQFGFSVTIQQIQLVGEGTLKRAATLLQAKLAAEGLFDDDRKRPLPYPPSRIGLITSGESAAYHDFMKIVRARWSGVEILHVDVQVQGMDAPGQIIHAITLCNQQADEPDVIVIIRGGGSPEDLQAFSDESVVRAVAGSRVPTLVAIGHENDISLAELAADLRASTPSNAAELLTPDKSHILDSLKAREKSFSQMLDSLLLRQKELVNKQKVQLQLASTALLNREWQQLHYKKGMLQAFNPQAALQRGYAIIKKGNAVIRDATGLQEGDIITVTMHDAEADALVQKVKKKG
jgi:exodeoxyribonuclease VII large subunit